MKRIILCADDYGQNTSVSQAIISLFQRKRLSATSCMTTSEHWPEHAKWLVEENFPVDLGVHLNLTEGKPLSGKFKFCDIKTLIAKSFLKQLKRNELILELRAQIQRFLDTIGERPHFLDGHQHIHHLPGVREAILEVYEEFFPDKKCYVRNVHSKFGKKLKLKVFIIQATGAKTFKNQLIRLKIPHIKSFSGIYNFKTANTYARIFPMFLESVDDMGLIMCHPGQGENPSDLINSSRVFENNYFNSDLFLHDCSAHEIQLSRFVF